MSELKSNDLKELLDAFRRYADAQPFESKSMKFEATLHEGVISHFRVSDPAWAQDGRIHFHRGRIDGGIDNANREYRRFFESSADTRWSPRDVWLPEIEEPDERTNDV